MELQSCMKAVISAINQYKTNPNDDAIHSCLLRQLDVFIGITSKKPLASFSPGELLLNQCLAAVISTMNDIHKKFLLAQKILTLFNNLVNSNAVCNILQNSFDLFGTLLDYFKLCSNPPHDLNLQLCIKVLQKVTYKKKVVIPLSKIEELLNYLLTNLECQDDGTKYRLGLLSNLTFKAPIIQSFIKSKENLKAILKRLMSYMSNSNNKIQIFAISILSNLCLHDDVGNKIFTGQNLSQMFHFLFNVLYISKSNTTQQHATDLFISIISNQRICDQLTEYSHLSQCLQLVISNILVPSLQTHRAVLELLLSFSSVPKLRSHMCNLLLNHPTCQDPSLGLESVLAQEKSCFFFSLIATIIRDDHSVSILCLDLILSLCSGQENSWNGRLDILVPALTRVLFSSQASDGCSKSLKLLRATQILKMLSSMTDKIRDHLNVEICLELIHSHIDCLGGIFLSSSLHSVKINKNEVNLQSFLKHSDLNQEDNNFHGKPCLELVLQLVDFLTMYHFKDERVQDILEDPRFMPFIVNGLTSVTKECIVISLKILQFLKTEHFSFNLLLDSILRTNQQRHDTGCKQLPNNLFPVEICSVSTFDPSAEAFPYVISQNVNEMIASLIERIRSSTEIKDFKTSEIMSIYEFKLQDLQRKEKILQDLLDARSETLNQSERVLSELKLRLAQHEAEAQNLRLLVLDSEKRKDELNDKVNKQTVRIESLQAEHDLIQRENSRLSEIEKKYKALNLNYSGVSQKLESCQRSLESLKQDHQALSEMDEMLKKRHETLRDQHEALASKLASVEDEKSLLSIELKENSQHVTELARTLAFCEDELKKKSTECEELESSMEKLQTELSRNVQSNKDLHHQVSSMELLCHQREVIIKEKDGLIQQYRKELDNYVQAAALFHKLTSGTSKTEIGS